VRRLRCEAAAALAALIVAAPAGAMGDPSVAALQTGLHRRGLYDSTIDGLRGPATTAAVRALQRRGRLSPDGVFGRRTRGLLGRFGRPRIGSRVVVQGSRGWDVAALQFSLAWHGFPSGPFDGYVGPRTESALRRFQRWAGLVVDGRAGPATLAALRQPPVSSPVTVAMPVSGALSSPFGPRGARFHAGVDLAAPTGTRVVAAAPGRVAYAGYRYGGWGNFVAVDHGNGIRTFYAHLSRVSVTLGQVVGEGSELGLVGATGDATGPHLHFQVMVRGAAVDPLTALPGL
jgi:peptidoglycan hydrolase-like protein with peptidoglycan-binding domain